MDAPAERRRAGLPHPSGRTSLPQAYDQHLNMILGDVEEVVTTVDIDEETFEEIIRVSAAGAAGGGGIGSNRPMHQVGARP